MTDAEFSRGLVEQVVDQNTAIYDDLFRSTPSQSATDAYWKAASGLFASLTAEQRDTFISVLRQVTVDAVASVLAVVDGVSSLPEQSAPLELRAGGAVLSGALQDQFLAAVEAQ